MKIELGIVLCVVSTGSSVLLHSIKRSNVRNINFDFIVIDVNIFIFGISGFLSFIHFHPRITIFVNRIHSAARLFYSLWFIVVHYIDLRAIVPGQMIIIIQLYTLFDKFIAFICKCTVLRLVFVYVFFVCLTFLLGSNDVVVGSYNTFQTNQIHWMLFVE